MLRSTQRFWEKNVLDEVTRLASQVPSNVGSQQEVVKQEGFETEDQLELVSKAAMRQKFQA